MLTSRPLAYALSHLAIRSANSSLASSPFAPLTARTMTHLFHILQHHIRMPIKRLDPRQQFLVIPQTNQDLGLIPDSLLEDR